MRFIQPWQRTDTQLVLTKIAHQNVLVYTTTCARALLRVMHVRVDVKTLGHLCIYINNYIDNQQLSVRFTLLIEE
jgi:hypothetical protein